MELEQTVEKEIRLWSNQSSEAMKLADQLTENGFTVNHYFSGSIKPKIYSPTISIGYQDIQIDYCRQPFIEAS